MLPDIGKVSDRIERLVIANEVASYIGITEKQALEEFRKAVNGRRPEMARVAGLRIASICPTTHLAVERAISFADLPTVNHYPDQRQRER